MDYLTAEQVLFIHARLIEETGGEHGIRDLGLLISAIERPRATFDKKELYADIFAKAAALFDSLIRNHPFLDGNKRTGITSASLFLLRNGYRFTAGDEELIDFTLACAQSQRTLEEIASWYKENTNRISNS
jgi:death-on-curing protein